MYYKLHCGVLTMNVHHVL